LLEQPFRAAYAEQKIWWVPIIGDDRHLTEEKWQAWDASLKAGSTRAPVGAKEFSVSALGGRQETIRVP